MDEQKDTTYKTLKKHHELSFSAMIFLSLTSLYFLGLAALIILLIDNNILITLLLLCVIIASIIVTFIRFGKYSVSSNRVHIDIEKGGFNPTRHTIPYDKISGLIIKRSFPRRVFNIVSIEIIMDDVDRDRTIKMTLFPLIHKQKLHSVLLDIFPHVKIEHNLRPIPKQAVFVNLVQPSYLLIIVTFFIFFFWPEYWYIPLGLFVSFVFYRLFKTAWTKYDQAAQWIQLQTGVWSTELFITKREKIDSLTMSQSWLQQRFRLATISFYTSSKSTFLHQIEHIPIETAHELVQWFDDNQ